MTSTTFKKHLALFFSGAMFWGAVTHTYLAIKKIETTTFGIKIDAEKNWLGVIFHIALGVLLFWVYKKKSANINNASMG